MPNWCFTLYAVEGSKEKIDDLHNKIESLSKRDEPQAPSFFGKMWLRNLIELLGGNPTKICCRGKICEWERVSDTLLTYQTMTAWGELNAVREFIQQKYPTLKIYYQAEESGCEYYKTNDSEGKYFPERYVVNQSDGCEQFIFTEGEEQEFFNDITTLTGETVTTIEEAKNAVHEYNANHEDWIDLKIFSVTI